MSHPWHGKSYSATASPGSDITDRRDARTQELDPTDRLLRVPPEVVHAAVLVRKWVAANLGDMKEVRIAGVGARTFLTVEEMLRERVPEIRISELKDSRGDSADERRESGK